LDGAAVGLSEIEQMKKNASTGILLNDEMDDFATAPGKPNIKSRLKLVNPAS
jgi:gamma-glutamyltranspeptidase